MKPALAPKVRLRWDSQAGQTLLLAPERGLLLDEPATAIACLCDGTRTIAEIAFELAFDHDGDVAAIERDVGALVDALYVRGLVCMEE